MYTDRNFKSKKALKEAVDAWNAWIAAPTPSEPTPHFHPPRPVTYHQAGPFGGNEPRDGTFCVEGPHFPEPHRWYATCTAKDGVIVKVK